MRQSNEMRDPYARWAPKKAASNSIIFEVDPIYRIAAERSLIREPLFGMRRRHAGI